MPNKMKKNNKLQVQGLKQAKKPRDTKTVAISTSHKNNTHNTASRGLRNGGMSGHSEAARQYYKALTRPFDVMSIGARVPDQWSAPTSTHHIKKLVTITSDAAGKISAIVLPNLYCHMVTPHGTLSTGNTWTDWVGSAVGSSLLYSDPVANKAQVSNARIVSYGLRLKNIASFSNVAGRVTVAKIPIKDNEFIPQINAIGGSTANNGFMTKERFYSNSGIPYNGTGGSALPDIDGLEELPCTATVTCVELAERGLDVIPRVITPEAFKFKNVSDSYYGNDPVPGIATGSIFVGDADYVKFGGFETIVFAGTGFPVSTAVLTAELIYHIEGTPTISAGAATGMVSDSNNVAPVDMEGFFRALDLAASTAAFVIPKIESAAALVAGLSL